MKPLLVSFAVAVALAPVAWAQPAIEARMAGSLDRITPSGEPAHDRGAYAVQLAPSFEFDGRHGRVAYAFDTGSFATPGDWAFLSHDLQGVYRVDLRKEKAKLFLGANATGRANGDDWAAADYKGIGGFANFELKPSASAAIRTGYRVDRRWFEDLGELDQTEQSGFLSANVGLPSRTTLIGETRVGWKTYAGAAAAPYVPLASESASRGRGMGPSVRQTSVAVPTAAAPAATGESARLVAVLGRVAQSLGDRTGAWLQYAARWTSGDVPPALVSTPALFFDDGVYDDPFASDARSLGAGLKHAFAGGASIQAFGSWRRKQYRGLQALGADGLPLASGELRLDRIAAFGAGAETPFLGSKTGRGELSLSLSYQFTSHQSNDVFYDYAAHSLGLSLGFRF